MTASIEPTRMCPSCGWTIVSEAKSCPQCGKEIADSDKRPEKAKRKTSKVTKVECPHCGELISKRSKKCPACRTSLKTGFYKASNKSVDNATGEPNLDPVAQVVQVAEDEPISPLGSGSEMVHRESEPKCRGCEAPLEGGTNTTEATVPIEPPHSEELAEKMEAQTKTVEEVTLVASALVEDSSGTVAGVTGTAEPIVFVDPMPGAEPSEVVEADKNTGETAAPVDSTPAKELPETGCVGNVIDSRLCQVCEAIVPLSSRVSLACIPSPVETTPQVEHAQPAVEVSKIQPRERLRILARKIENKQARPLRKRRVKSVQPSTVPAAVPANDQGGTDCVGNVTGPTTVGR